MFDEKVSDPPFNFPSNLPHARQWEASWILERPVVAHYAGYDGTRLATSHRDEHRRPRRETSVSLCGIADTRSMPSSRMTVTTSG